jgi:hypothetical protein
MGIDALEDECIHRAMDGSDTLLMFMLRARRPDKFRDRRSWEVHSNYGDDFRRIPMDELCVERSFAWLRSYRRGNQGSPKNKRSVSAQKFAAADSKSPASTIRLFLGGHSAPDV